MTIGLLFDYEEAVISYLLRKYGIKVRKFDAAIGLVNSHKILRGAVIFHFYNGFNVEMSYFGEGTMTAGIARCLARFAICTFDPSRVTVRTNKRNKRYIRAFQKFGFKLEGIEHRYYGKEDTLRNTAVRLVMFRDRINAIAWIADVNVPSPRLHAGSNK